MRILTSYILRGYIFLPIIIMNAMGLESTPLTPPDSNYYVVNINLAQDNLALYWRTPEGKPFQNFSNLRDFLMSKQESLIFATNAGIYTQDNKPLGLHIENNDVLTGLNKTNPINAKGNFSLKPNGVFYVIKQQANILETSQFDLLFNTEQKLRTINFATQSGPMLLMQGNVHPRFIKGSDSLKFRSGVCVKDQEKFPHTVIFAVSLIPVSFYDFALFFKDKQHCQNALYLDGSLSQIYNNNQYYGAPFWKIKPYVGILAVSKKTNLELSNQANDKD